MSKLVGNKISEDAMELLGIRNTERGNSVIFLLTPDDENTPHVAMLSPFQVAAVNDSTILLSIHASSLSSRFLSTRMHGTFILQIPPSAQYVECLFKELPQHGFSIGDQNLTVFISDVQKVLEDYSEAAPLVSQTAFDVSAVAEPYRMEFMKLCSIARFI